MSKFKIGILKIIEYLIFVVIVLLPLAVWKVIDIINHLKNRICP